MKTCTRRSLAACVAIALLLAAGNAQNTRADTAILAQTGQAAPDGNGTYSTFFVPGLNASGQVTFRSDLTGTSGGSIDNSGIFLGSVGVVTQIARKGQAAPDGNGTYSIFPSVPALNASGQVAFRGDLTGTSGGASDDSGIFLGSGGVVTQIAREGQAAPDGNGTYSIFPSVPALNASGQVAFRSDLTGTTGASIDNSGNFFGSGGVVTQIARKGQAAPDGNGTYSNFSNPVLNASGQAAFRGDLTGTSGGASDDSGIFLGSGGVVTQIAREGQAAPDGNGTYSIFPSVPGLNASGQVAFRSDLTGTSGGSIDNSGIFLGSVGVVAQIARKGQAAPDGNGTYSIFPSVPALNASGQVAFRGDLTGTSGGASDDSGIFLGSGGVVTQIAREGQAAPDGNGTYSIFPSVPALNASGQVAFRSDLTGTSGAASDDRGLFLADGQEIIQVAREGQALAGSTITTFNFLSSSGLNDFGQVAYQASLANAQQVIGLFTPSLNWRSAGDGSWDAATNWTLSIGPALVHDTTIDPTAASTVSGPSTATTVKSLTIGGGANEAELKLAAGVNFTALDGLFVGTQGTLSGGTTAARASIIGNVTSAGTIAPGNSPGAMSIDGNLVNTGVLEFEIASLDRFDSLEVSGTFDAGGMLSIVLDGYAPVSGDSFQIMTFGSMIDGDYAFDFSNAELGSGLSWDVSAFSTSGVISVLVPEPSMVALATLGLAGLGLQAWRRRLRRRSSISMECGARS